MHEKYPMPDLLCKKATLLVLAALSAAAAADARATVHARAAPEARAAAEQSAPAAPPAPVAEKSARLDVVAHPPLDRSGNKKVGKASFYAHMFEGRKMADGNAMDPKRNNAASRTLPLGTTAKVTNLNTGKSAVVVIQDRGPYVSGRIVDLSPATAKAIGITPRQGVAKVQVSPITVPLPNGGMKYGAEIQEARLASNERARQFPPVGW
jgi:rare lipoprotein A